MVSPASRRKAARYAVEGGLGRIAQTCRALELARSGYYRAKKVSPSSRQMGHRVVALSREHPRYGYRRITALLRREGCKVNPKRVARVRRAEGLQVRKRQRRLRRVGPGQQERLRAMQRNEVWSWDFVSDQTENGSAFRILTLIDEHTRQCLAAHVAWSIRATDVLAVLAAVMREHGVPQHIRSDNGPEFIAYAIQDWLRERQIKTLYIKPGSPWENAYIESFHDKLRDECLKREVFGNLAEARVVIGQWKQHYNEYRPHSSLGYRTPAEVVARCQTALQPRLATLDEPSAPFDSASPQRQTSNPRTLELHL
jgi:transposase InsO family protein